MVGWRTIKPRKFRDAAFELAFARAAQLTQRGIAADFEKTHKTWDHDPKFVSTIRRRAGATVVRVATTDDIYRFVTRGTKRHKIVAKNSPVLVFKGTYKAKTLPGTVRSRSGGSSGPTVVAREVQHPGTKARNFDKLIAADWRKKLRRIYLQFMKDAARASGHGIKA